jgi:hypothetical protein
MSGMVFWSQPLFSEADSQNRTTAILKNVDPQGSGCGYSRSAPHFFASLIEA